jgi:hypothetical protein
VDIAMPLQVLHFIICDRVRVDPTNLHLFNIDGLRTSIRSKQIPRFPLEMPGLTALAILMGCGVQGEISTQLVAEGSQQILSKSRQPLRVRFVGDPHTVTGIKFTVPNCKFPREGLYWMELVFSGEVIAKQPIRVH